MPIEYKSYGCQFKCGYRHSERKAAIVSHEATCWDNPATKTCKTCEFEDVERDCEVHDELPGRYIERFFIRNCALPEGEILIEEKYEELKTVTGWVKPIVNCPFYKQKKS